MPPTDARSQTPPRKQLDAETVETAFTSLLALYPKAPVLALGPHGVGVPMPDSVPLQSNPVLEVRTGLDLVLQEDRLAVLATWDQVLATGAAHCHMRFASNREVVVYHGFDLREAHDVVVSVYVPSDTDHSPVLDARAAEIDTARPRFARIDKDGSSFITRIDEATTQILGWSAGEMEGHRSLDFIHPDDHPLAIDNWMQMLAAPGPGRRVRLRHRRREGSWVWFEVTNHNLLEDPDHGYVVSEMVDISEEMAAHELVDRLAETVPVGLFQVDADRQIVYTNDRLHEIVGIERMDTLETQLDSVVERDRPALRAALDDVLGAGLPADIEVELRASGGRGLRSCTISLRALHGGDGASSGAIGCVADVTEGARMREELQRRATFDDLTGCYNRASIMHALETNLSGKGRERAVIFVDLDRFKQVNDRCGHAVGDEVLATVAKRLRGAVRSDDLVGRIGGDEFLVVCPEIGGPDDAVKLAERMANRLKEDISLAAGSIAPRASVGVVWSDEVNANADALVAEADRAMYESKRAGSRPRLITMGPATSPGGR
jgi:diguanylate cyclase (GGDEF)-like protein/PAS domain S-box-containing protein